MQKTWISAFVGAAALAALSGCSNPECRQNSDCASKGADLVCRNEQCVTPSEVLEDAGVEVDAGIIVDAGVTVDAGTDAGVMDAGVDAGPLPSDFIAVTTGTTAAPRAALVSMDGGITYLSDVGVKSKFPRFSADGTGVAFVSEGTGPKELRFRALLSPNSSVLLNAADNSFDDFADLEFSPGPAPVWAKVSGASVSGLQWIPTDGGALVDVLSSGRSPDWQGDGGTRIAYANFQGIKSVNSNGTDDVLNNTGGAAPKYNAAGTQLAFTQSAGTQANLDDQVWVVNTSGGAAKLVAPTIAPDGGNPGDGGYEGGPGRFAALPAWSPSSNTLTYVEVRYIPRPAMPGGTPVPTICSDISNCANEEPFSVVLLKVDATTGDAIGSPIRIASGTLPSISPGDRFVAYIAAGQLKIQQIDANGNPVGSPKTITTPSIPTGFADDDSRPRWQPAH